MALKNILIVDDSKLFRAQVGRWTTKLGLQPQPVDSGAACLEYLKQHQADIDLIFMDLIMPEMDGYQTIEALRNDDAIAEPPIIAWTLTMSAADTEKLFKLGVLDIRDKPTNLDGMKTTLTEVTPLWLEAQAERAQQAATQAEQAQAAALAAAAAITEASSEPADIALEQAAAIIIDEAPTAPAALAAAADPSEPTPSPALNIDIPLEELSLSLDDEDTPEPPVAEPESVEPVDLEPYMDKARRSADIPVEELSFSANKDNPNPASIAMPTDATNSADLASPFAEEPLISPADIPLEDITFTAEPNAAATDAEPAASNPAIPSVQQVREQVAPKALKSAAVLKQRLEKVVSKGALNALEKHSQTLADSGDFTHQVGNERRMSSTRMAIEQIALRVAEQTAQKMSEQLITTVSLMAEKLAHDIRDQLLQSGEFTPTPRAPELSAESAANPHKAAKPAISRPKTPASE